MSACWETRYKELQTYKKEHGSCRVPAHRDKLGRWVERQRTNYRMGKLDAEKIEKLDRIGFEWKLQSQRKPCYPVCSEFHDEAFKRMLEKVKAFVKKEGHCRIPQRYPADPQLGRWVKNRRSEKKHGTLDKDREKSLNEVGFEWQPKKTFCASCHYLGKPGNLV